MQPVSVIAGFCLLASSAAAHAVGDSSELDDLVARIEETRRHFDIPAVAVVLADDSRTLRTALLGTTDRQSGRPVDGQTLFRIGSITKMFTSLALLIAAEEGRLSLDAPAAGVAADFPVRNPWEQTHPLRIAHLLEHTAGLPDMTPEEFDYPKPMPLRAALAWKVETRRCLWPPGLHHSYSNLGAGLAALVLEEATGMRYEDFVAERIFAPLDMHSAGFFADPPTLEALATGYGDDGRTVIPYWHMLYRAFGAINVRPAEMGAFLQMLINEGEYRRRRIVSAASIRRMETPVTTLAARSGLRYGYGLGNYTWLHNGVLFHGHGGDADGYLARLGYSRARKMGYFIVINVFRGTDLDRIRALVEDFIAGDAAVETPEEYAVAAATLSQYAGTYEAVTERFPRRKDPAPLRFAIRRQGSRLFMERFGRRLRLVPVNDRHFRFEDEPVATMAFVADGGKQYFQDDTGSYVRVTGNR